MAAWAYYNEHEPFAVEWLRNLMRDGLIAPGVVDDRSIADVRAHELTGFSQHHFFAGLGGWSLAARLAGWPDWLPLWTASCPCQPFSVAGRGGGTEDERHLWPEFFRLVDHWRPYAVVGEQVSAAVGKDWLDGVYADMESSHYSGWSPIVPACAVDAPHRRDRIWFVFRRLLVDVAQQRRGEGRAGHDLLGRRETSSGAGAFGVGDRRDGDLADALRDGLQGGQPLGAEPGGRRPVHAGGANDGALEHADFSRAGEEWQQRGREQRGLGSHPQACASDVAHASHGRRDGLPQRGGDESHGSHFGRPEIGGQPGARGEGFPGRGSLDMGYAARERWERARDEWTRRLAELADGSGFHVEHSDGGGQPGVAGAEGAFGTDLSGSSGGALAYDGRQGLPASERPRGRLPEVLGYDPDQLWEAASERGRVGPWADSAWLPGADGKLRRVKPGLLLLAHGISGRVGQLRAIGNAIVPQVAATALRALLDDEGGPLAVRDRTVFSHDGYMGRAP